jgi:hypothetical protein
MWSPDQAIAEALGASGFWVLIWALKIA